MKKLLFISLIPFCAYAADQKPKDGLVNVLTEHLKTLTLDDAQKDGIVGVVTTHLKRCSLDDQAPKKPYNPFKEELEEWESEKKFGGPIDPSKFNDFGKKILTGYISVWIAAADQGKIPQDKGLAKVFADMQTDGIEKVINDGLALKNANSYLAEYEKSPAAKIERIIKNELNPDSDGNNYFDGAAETNVDCIRVTRQRAFHNIMYKRHEAPIMPKEKLVQWYYDQTTDSALEALKLNENNETLKPTAIRGIALLSVYLYQNDQDDQE
jgi:hypothetical protein